MSSWPPPPPPQPVPRRRMDPRWLTVIVIGVIAIIILDRQHRIHISEFDVLYFAAVIPSVIIHEVSHGWVAYAFGDDTAKRAHRLSLNPLVHISIWGSLIFPAVLVLAGYPAFGWAKPVPVNLSRLRSPRNQAVLVALAGPLTNIILAVCFGLIFGATLSEVTRINVVAADSAQIIPQSSVGVWPQYLFFLGYANVILAVFNLFPIPPLDGSSIVERFIPRSWLPGYLSIRPYTIFLPFVLIMLHPAWFDDVFNPFISAWGHLLGSGIS